MENRKEMEIQLEEYRKQREEAKKFAVQFCQDHITRLEQKNFDINFFLADLKKFDEETFELAIGGLIRENKSFWQNLSESELKVFIEYVVTTSWFKKTNSFSDSQKRDFLSAASRNINAISVLSSIYKDTAKKNPEASKYIADQLAESENGRAELINILKIDDAEIQYLALVALANHCIMSGIEPAYIKDDNPLYINMIRGFVFHSNGRLSRIAVIALHEGELLNVDEIIKLMQLGGSQRTWVGLAATRYLRIESSKARELCSLVVKALEDNSIDVSNVAMEAIGRLSEKFHELLAEEILDALVVRKSGYPKEFFNTNIVTSALRETFKHNPRLPGGILHKLCDIAYTSNIEARNRAVFVAMALNKREFLALVNERRESNPSAAKAILNTVTGTLDTDQIANQISQTDPKDVQQNAANQITVLAKYYENGLLQAKASFNWAIAITIFSILSFIVAVLLFMNNTDKTGTIIATVGGTLTQLIAGTLLFIYRRTLMQLDNYTQQMNRIQNYLLANSFIESLDGDEKQRARVDLIKTVATGSNSNIISTATN